MEAWSAWRIVRRQACDDALRVSLVTALVKRCCTYDDGEGDAKIVKHAPVAVEILLVTQLGELVFIPCLNIWFLCLHIVGVA